MSTLDRFQRIVKSWTGIFKGEPRIWLGYNEARIMITSVGMAMSPDAYQKIMFSQTLQDDFLAQFYAAEEATGKTLITEFNEIDSELKPEVAEEPGRVVITILINGERKILADLKV
jgi:hypothetical protein